MVLSENIFFKTEEKQVLCHLSKSTQPSPFPSNPNTLLQHVDPYDGGATRRSFRITTPPVTFAPVALGVVAVAHGGGS